MNISTVLRGWRHHEELTLAEAAKRIEIPLPTLAALEKGRGFNGRTMLALICFLFERQ